MTGLVCVLVCCYCITVINSPAGTVLSNESNQIKLNLVGFPSCTNVFWHFKV